MKMDIVLQPLSRDEKNEELRLSPDLWGAIVEVSSRNGFTLESRLSGPDGRHAVRALRQGLKQVESQFVATVPSGRGSSRFSTAHQTPAAAYPYRVFTDANALQQLRDVIAFLEQGKGLFVSERVPR
jgi:hypothetical protein